MILLDVNVLLYSHREDVPRHAEYRAWLETLWQASSSYGYSEFVLSSCLRILTHGRVFATPTPMAVALAFVNQIREHPLAVRITPGDRHWMIFCDLCGGTGMKGNLVADAYLAALAIESDCEWITTDEDFARFPHLKYRHPLER